MKAPVETFAYVASFDPAGKTADALAIVDVNPKSKDYSTITGTVKMPNKGDELHHFGWNACSSCLCPNAPHAHAERRYLIVPGLRSSRIHVLDTKTNPKKPKIVKVIEPAEIAEKANYSRPHTIHCGPEGIYVTCLADGNGKAPGGIFLMDHETFAVLGRWELDRGPQQLSYDSWWHLGHDTLITSEWGTPDTFENGLVPEVLLNSRYGRRLHFWDLHKRKHMQEIDFGAEHQLVFELRPAHDPTKAYGFVNCVISLKDLSSSIWTWHRENGKWSARKIIEIPAEPADESLLPPALKPFKAVPPLVTDIDLSMDDTTAFSTYPAGARAICSNMTSPIPSAPSSPARSGSAALFRALDTPGPRASLTVARRWSRSAAMAAVSISPIRCTEPSIRNSTKAGSRAGW
jgi:selenium-binding protein 1